MTWWPIKDYGFADIFCAINVIKNVEHSKLTKGMILGFVQKLHKSSDISSLESHIEFLLKSKHILILPASLIDGNKTRNQITSLEHITDSGAKSKGILCITGSDSDSGFFLERITNDLKWDGTFLRDQLTDKDSYYWEAISFIRNNLNSVYITNSFAWRDWFHCYRENSKLQKSHWTSWTCQETRK